MSIIRPDDPIRLLVAEPFVEIEPGASLSDVAAKLELEQVGAVVVMSADRLEGVLSERDIVRAMTASSEPVELWTADVMTPDPAVVDGDDPIIVAAERMLDEGVRHLPVISDGRVLGVVSMRDVLRIFTDAWQRSTRQP